MHHGAAPLLLVNAWDRGSASLLASLGFDALATTSSGFAATLGRLDGGATRDEVLANASAIADASVLPVSADLENGYATDAAGVTQTIGLAIEAGLAGCSVEDYSGDEARPIYEIAEATARVAAAADAAHAGAVRLVLTARAENHLHGRGDLDDTIERLRAYERAGADVLYAPGLIDIDEIRRVVESVHAPVNVLARPGMAPVGELAAVGVKRISVGGAFAFAALGAAVTAAIELRDAGTYGFLEQTAAGSRAAREAFDPAREAFDQGSR